MNKKITKYYTVISIVLMLAVWSNSYSAPNLDVSIKHEAEHSIAVALAYLAKTQQDNGSWSHYPGVTGLVLTAYARAPEKLKDKYKEQIVSGYKFLIEHVQTDGGIYPSVEPQLKAYNTSICLMAFVAAENPGFEETIINARRYLMSLQADEDEGLTPDSSTYGGIGYNSDERSDISNMQFALEAIRASEDFRPHMDDVDVSMEDDESSQVPEPVDEDLFWEKAIQFLERCQNYKKYNDYQWSGNDGGFVYYPGVSKAGGTTSYGGMTYAGMKSFIHAGLDRQDERVRAAYDWLRGNYTVEENPELGRQGLFYYYHTMAKALTIYGDSLLIDTTGETHNWRRDLTGKLIEIQQSDGSWVNDNGRWWENNPDLVTAYSVLALEVLIG